MTQTEYENLIKIYRDSVSPEIPLKADTVRWWYFIYFQYYEVDEFEKVIKYLIENKIKPIIGDMLDEFKKFFGFLLHEEVAKAIKIIKQAEKEGVKVCEKKYPKLANKYDLPVAQAWEIAVNTGKKETKNK
jgi:hypothetical protein